MFRWERGIFGKIPTNAIEIGTNSEFYVARGYYHNGEHPGIANQEGCIISFGGKAIFVDEYEILTARRGVYQWISCNKDYLFKQILKYKIVGKVTKLF